MTPCSGSRGMWALSRERQPRGVVRNFHLPLLRDQFKLILAQRQRVWVGRAGSLFVAPPPSTTGQGRFPLPSPRGRPPQRTMTLFAPAVNTPNFVSVGLRRNDRFERPGVGRPISSPGSG